MASVGLRAVNKYYGSDHVVKDVDLDVCEGEFVVLLGPSGCGKTTTLRMVAGLEPPSSGELRFDGRLANDVPAERRDVGMVFQNYALFPHMTVSENLAFGLRSRGASKAEAERQVREVADLLGLEAVLTHRPRALSGGQRQRVALGRAILRKPAVFLMDEPLSNLDAKLRERMRTELRQLHARLGVTTLYVTHDQQEALTLANRVVVMHEGRVRQFGTAAELYAKPADTFVAGFVGSPGMNLWTSSWDSRQDGVHLAAGLRLPLAFASTLARVGGAVTAGIRPEHLRPVGGGTAARSDATVSCTVDAVDDMGSHLHVRGTLDGAESREVVLRLDTGPKPRRGELLSLAAPATAVHLFDTESGARLDVPSDVPRGELVGDGGWR